ncbi:MAG: 2'-5' RNA ligase family protein [Candidatus Kaiserbacteria bacterium]|nr:2'-5' RNA ligase family protein [Candidatus Kaiserbacteria bacterium]
MNTYLILFLIPNPFCIRLCRLMDGITSITGLTPPYRNLPPHVTFHRPLTGIVDETVLKELLRDTVARMRQTRITLHGLSTFEKQFVILPVQATRGAATLWVEIAKVLSQLPEYKPGEYDNDNTLHVTVAEKTSRIFDQVWPKIRNIETEIMHIPLQRIALYRKPFEGGVWKQIATFPIPV